jgi:hypothetical protein
VSKVLFGNFFLFVFVCFFSNTGRISGFALVDIAGNAVVRDRGELFWDILSSRKWLDRFERVAVEDKGGVISQRIVELFIEWHQCEPILSFLGTNDFSSIYFICLILNPFRFVCIVCVFFPSIPVQSSAPKPTEAFFNLFLKLQRSVSVRASMISTAVPAMVRL